MSAMGKLLQYLLWPPRRCARLVVNFFRLLAWLAKKFWDWGAIFFAVAGLWAFGGIGIGAAVAEPIPSAVEIAGAGMLIWLGGLLLLIRILHSVWKTTELTSAFQRGAATVIVILLFVVFTRLGGSYISGKVPLLSIDLAQAVPHLVSPPLESPKAAHIPSREKQAIAVGSINVRVPSKAGDDAAADVGISLAGSNATTVLMGELTGTWDFYPDDPVKQTGAENTLWEMLLEHDRAGPRSPLAMPANNKALVLPLTIKSVKDDQLQLVNAGTRSYYFLCRVTDQKDKILLELCFHADSKGATTYCRVHNGP